MGGIYHKFINETFGSILVIKSNTGIHKMYDCEITFEISLDCEKKIIENCNVEILYFNKFSNNKKTNISTNIQNVKLYDFHKKLLESKWKKNNKYLESDEIYKKLVESKWKKNIEHMDYILATIFTSNNIIDLGLKLTVDDFYKIL
jgi:hypothetical protein